MSAVVVVVAVACGGDDAPVQTPSSAASETGAAATTPEATSVATDPAAANGSATPGPTITPGTLSQEFRDFAPQIAAAAENEDIEFFLDHAIAVQVTCTEAGVQIEGFFAACETVGQQFQGMALSVWGLEVGGLVPGERVLGLIQSLWEANANGGSDAFGESKARLYALGANPQDGYDAQLAVITAMVPRPAGMEGTGPVRVALVTHWRFEEGDWRLFEVMQSVPYTEELLEPTDTGRQYINDWEQYQP
jgi:hypothetical protein